MTVSEAFSIFKSELELPDRKATQAAAAQQALRTAIGKCLDVPDSFLAGSYARHTKIDPLNDIDVFLVRNRVRTGVNSDGSGIFPGTALEQVASAIRSAYGARAKIKMQKRSVNVEIQGVPFGFDLVPAWLRSPDGFWIPDTSTNGWMPSNPQWHADLMTAANEASGGRLKPLVKMAKHWSRQNYDLLCSFHIELVCREILAGENILNWQFGMAAILVHLQKYVGQAMKDPAYGATRVDKELSAEELSALSFRISSDADRAIDALRREKAGDESGAVTAWKEIFINGFPRNY